MKILPQILPAMKQNAPVIQNQPTVIRQQNKDTFECTTKKEVPFGSSENENLYNQILQNPKEFGNLMGTMYEKMLTILRDNALKEQEETQALQDEAEEYASLMDVVESKEPTKEEKAEILRQKRIEIMAKARAKRAENLAKAQETTEQIKVEEPIETNEVAIATNEVAAKPSRRIKKMDTRHGLILRRGRQPLEVQGLQKVLPELKDTSDEVYNSLIDIVNPLIVAKDYEKLSKIVKDLNDSDKTDDVVKTITEKYSEKEEKISTEKPTKDKTKCNKKEKSEPYTIKVETKGGKNKVNVTFNLSQEIRDNKPVKKLEEFTSDLTCKMTFDDINKFVGVISEYITNDVEVIAKIKNVLGKAWTDKYKTRATISTQETDKILNEIKEKLEQTTTQPEVSQPKKKRELTEQECLHQNIRENIAKYPQEYRQILQEHWKNISTFKNFELEKEFNLILTKANGSEATAKDNFKEFQTIILNAVNIQEECDKKVANMKPKLKELFLNDSPIAVSIADNFGCTPEECNLIELQKYIDKDVKDCAGNGKPYKNINCKNVPIIANIIKYLGKEYKQRYSIHSIMRLIDRFIVLDCNEISYMNIDKNLPKLLEEKLDCLEKVMKYTMLTDSLKGYECNFVHELNGYKTQSKGLKIKIKSSDILDEQFKKIVEKNFGTEPITICINRDGNGGYTIATAYEETT